MLISPARKRYDELQQRLREIRNVGQPQPEEQELEQELNQLKEQLEAEKSSSPPLLKG